MSDRESPLTPSDIVVKMSGAICHCRTCLHDFVFIIKHKDNCTLTDEVATQTLLCTDGLLAVTSQKEGFRLTYHFLYLCTVFQYASGALYDPISWCFISVRTLDFFSLTLLKCFWNTFIALYHANGSSLPVDKRGRSVKFTAHI